MGGINILIVEARFYDDITDNLVRGAVATLTRQGADYKRLILPGILEIPAALHCVVQAIEWRVTAHRFAGYVVLGCAIQGETDHYKHVSRESMHGVQNIALRHSLALGNGILTCPTYELARRRSDPVQGNHGGRAATAALRMVQVKREFGL
ncbi:6,7-dimethyl-8-ribityllumazine synthase [invertebrate metagenome]|uniref:6,7-dimethyl-8-ribityllumazine synthase n=1 Tax=invertebrate metagenome TaxID=1711999 RepID=A0A484HB18_9ZZZZ